MTSMQLKEICKTFVLGVPISEGVKVYGGLLHLMWHVTTDKASYAIKQISQNIDLKNERIRKNYELTEQVAFDFSQQGIPAISAIKHEGKHLIEINETFFLVYPWIHAQALDKELVSQHHALIIANILAKMHAINLQVPELTESHFDVHRANSIVELIDMAQARNASFAQSLQDYQADIVAINDAYHKAILLLEKHSVVSHGDLDQKNVLWDKNDQPILIDWESVRKLNPTYDIITVSLDWSGISSNHFNPELFVKMIHTYVAAGGILEKDILHAAFYGVMGNLIHWMVYNLKRACKESEEKELGREQVNQVIPTIMKIKNTMPDLMAMIMTYEMEKKESL